MIYGFPSQYSGVYKVKCIKAGGHTIRGVVFSQNQEIDLLDKDTNTAIRCYDYDTAHRMCTGAGCPFTLEIEASRFEVTQATKPDIAEWVNDPRPDLWGT